MPLSIGVLGKKRIKYSICIKYKVLFQEVTLSIEKLYLKFDDKIIKSNISMNKVRKGISLNYEAWLFVDFKDFKASILLSKSLSFPTNRIDSFTGQYSV